ncbi:MAG: hypothetical protein Q9221_003984 [Calogaya cf. arnoldii]
MDPASAAVAFVGFAGSIAALAAVVTESCKTLKNVWHIMKDGPQDTRRLFKRLKRLETIILEIKRVGEESTDETFRRGFQQCWIDNVEDMREDFSALQSKILKLEGFLTAKRFSRKHLCAQIRKLFSNEDIAKYEHILSGHMETFNMMLNLHSRYESEQNPGEALK